MSCHDCEVLRRSGSVSKCGVCIENKYESLKSKVAELEADLTESETHLEFVRNVLKEFQAENKRLREVLSEDNNPDTSEQVKGKLSKGGE